MKALILMQGAPGVGKSYILKQIGLENIAISPDSIRMMFGGLGQKVDLERPFSIPGVYDDRVWKTLFEIVEHRMSIGNMIIVDATHTSKKSVEAYRNLAKKYGYETFIFRTMEKLDEILFRNARRDRSKYVPEKAVEKKYEELQRFKKPSWVRKVYRVNDADDFEQALFDMKKLLVPEIELKTGEKFAVIGDIHGMKKEFEEAWKQLKREGIETVVFVGDYFDRFDDEKEMAELFEKLYKLSKEKKVFFLRGNHEPFLADREFVKLAAEESNLLARIEQAKEELEKAGSFLLQNGEFNAMSEEEICAEMERALERDDKERYRALKKALKAKKKSVELPFKIADMTENRLMEIQKAMNSIQASSQHKETLNVFKRRGLLEKYGKFSEKLLPCLTIRVKHGDGEGFCRYSLGFATHAGVMSNLASIEGFCFTSETDCVKGVGGYEDTDGLMKSFSQREPNILQVFGHRSASDRVVGNVVNVNGDPEFGGALTYAVIEGTEDPTKPWKIDVRQVKAKKRATRYAVKTRFLDGNIVKPAKNSPFLKVKALNDGIYSIQFRNEVFFQGLWNSMTVHARGLFVKKGENGDRIVARGFHKFFNLGEMPFTEKEFIGKNWSFPLVVEEKANGFLGIFSGYMGDDGEIKPFIASKSTNEGLFAGMFRELLTERCESVDELARFAYENGVSLVFEVVHRNDPHIQEYTDDDLVLIGVVKNEIDFKDLYESLHKEALRLLPGARGKRVKTVLRNPREFGLFVKEANSVPLDSKNYIEGYVMRSPDGKINGDPQMVKLKTDWYLFWKLMRSALEAFSRRGALDGRSADKYVRTASERFGKDGEKLAKEFLSFLISEKGMFSSIIEARNAFLASR